MSDRISCPSLSYLFVIESSSLWYIRLASESIHIHHIVLALLSKCSTLYQKSCREALHTFLDTDELKDFGMSVAVGTFHRKIHNLGLSLQSLNTNPISLKKILKPSQPRQGISIMLSSHTPFQHTPSKDSHYRTDFLAPKRVKLRLVSFSVETGVASCIISHLRRE